MENKHEPTVLDPGVKGGNPRGEPNTSTGEKAIWREMWGRSSSSHQGDISKRGMNSAGRGADDREPGRWGDEHQGLGGGGESQLPKVCRI